MRSSIYIIRWAFPEMTIVSVHSSYLEALSAMDKYKIKKPDAEKDFIIEEFKLDLTNDLYDY